MVMMVEQGVLETPEDHVAALEAENVRLRGEVERLRAGIQLLQVDIDNVNVDLAVKRRQITDLKNQVAGRVKSGQHGEEVQAAFDYWRLRCNHPRARLDHKRAKALETRLRIRVEQGEDPLREVMRAIDGAAFDAFVDEKGKRHDGISLICRDEDSFDRMRDRWAGTVQRGKLSVVLSAYCLPGGQLGPEFDVTEQAWRFRCPVCRMGWEHEDYLPLLVSPHLVYCEGACVGLTVEKIRAALVEHFPVVPQLGPA